MLSLQPFPKAHACCICTLLPRPRGPPAHALGAGEQLPWRNGRILRCESPHPSSMTCHGSPVPLRSVPNPPRLSPASSFQPPHLSPSPQPLDHLLHFPRLLGWPAARAFAYPSCLHCPACPCQFRRQRGLLPEAIPHPHPGPSPPPLGRPSSQGRRLCAHRRLPTGSRTPRGEGRAHQEGPQLAQRRAGRSARAPGCPVFAVLPPSSCLLPLSLSLIPPYSASLCPCLSLSCSSRLQLSVPVFP